MDQTTTAADPRAFRHALARVNDTIFTRLSDSTVSAVLKRLVPRRLAARVGQHDPAIECLALDLAVLTPDPKGRTVHHRLASRLRAELDADGRRALAALTDARFRVVRIDGPAEGDRMPASDVLDGTACALPAIAALPGEVVAGRFVTAPDGSRIPGSLVLSLPEGTRTLADIRTTRDGLAFRNGARAAETIYRRVVEVGLTHDDDLTPLVLVPPDVLADADAEAGSGAGSGAGGAHGPLRPRADAPQIIHDLVALSASWAELAASDPAEADPDGAKWLRAQSDPNLAYTLAEMIDIVPEGHPQRRTLDAMALVAMDTVVHRAALGIDKSLEDFLAASAHQGAPVPPHIQDRLHDLQRRVGRATGGADPELDRVIARIRALRTKTRDAGCTEAEAMAAAEKAEELLHKYDITLTPEAVGEQACDIVRFPTGRKRQDGLDTCVAAIADFCECWSWIEWDETETMTHALFGMPADVAAAAALFEVVQDTFDTETRAFKNSETYAATPSNQRGQATRSFRMGLANGIRDKLQQLKTDRVRHTQQSRGTDLVPAKTRTMQASLERLGIEFEMQHRRRAHLLNADSYKLGVASGRTFQPEPAVRPAAE